MEAKLFLLCITISIFIGQRSTAMPSVGKVIEVDQEPLDVDRRATWLDTRDPKESVKEIVYLSIQELAKEGKLNPEFVFGRVHDKRGRHQGFCFKKTKSGRFLPYICWKGESEQEEK